MSILSSPPRRSITLLLVGTFIFLVVLFTSFHNASSAAELAPSSISSKAQTLHVDKSGTPIAPKLGNETIKAELGRAAWRLFHTTMARFPEKPTADERAALKTYVYLFQRLYPCGECAGHFGKILDKYPPQVSSRSAAAGWGCHVHNEVNKSLKKEIFDCNNIGDAYDCGCAEDEPGDAHADERQDAAHVEKGAGLLREIAQDELHPVELDMEDYQKGG